MAKSKFTRFRIIAILLVIVLGYLVWDSYSQVSIEDLDGDFKEVAFVRNEQNKGGIIRIYAVTVGDPNKANYDECVKLFPINDFNSETKIFFFDKSKPFPTSLTIEPPHYDTNRYEAIQIVRKTGTNEAE